MRNKRTAAEVRGDLLACREIALIDVREEAIHAEGHPLFAANLSLSKLELEVYSRVPRRETPIVLLGEGEGLAELAAARLLSLGYTDVKLLEDGLRGWRAAGYEVFRDVNAPSKAFGELVESVRHTPSISAQEAKALIDNEADVIILDARRFEEFQVMSIPTGISVPGAELVLRAGAIAPTPETKIIVNCGGRTRSIIGAQSLINAGVPHPVAALRNGTIGWKLSGQILDHGQSRKFPEVEIEERLAAAALARQVANRCSVGQLDRATLELWIRAGNRTIYRFDVRTPEEYEVGHLPGFRNAPGGQLVQETDAFAPVRGAMVVLADDGGGRAYMTASWLKQMAWDVRVLVSPTEKSVSAPGQSVDESAQLLERGKVPQLLPKLPELPTDKLLSATRLREILGGECSDQTQSASAADSQTVILDLGSSAEYSRAHIPGAYFAIRSLFSEAFGAVSHAERYVLTSPDGAAGRFAWAEADRIAPGKVYVLNGGTAAWAEQEELTAANPRYASPPIDRYKRPYEGTDAPLSAMQAYLDWEAGLVEQLARDGTHGFHVI